MHIIKIESYDRYYDVAPNECPFCHHKINPDLVFAHLYYIPEQPHKLEIVFQCTFNECQHLFIGYYSGNSDVSFRFIDKVSIGTMKNKDFALEIAKISPSFIEIYNEAFYAEQMNLLQICGPGYRKAIEFLIKDYAISIDPTNKKSIEGKFLNNCIEDYILDQRIKAVSREAVWIGNDETHYIRKWEDKDLTDLKRFIEVTCYWIASTIITDGLLK